MIDEIEPGVMKDPHRAHMVLLREIEEIPDGPEPLPRAPVVLPADLTLPVVDRIFHEILQLRVIDYQYLRKKLADMF